MTEPDDFKSRQQTIWAAGDYSLIASRLVIVSELLCESVDLRANHRVLDVATGTGNTALAAARRGCDVIGIDITPSLLEMARQRAAAEHLPVNFQWGDAEDSPFPDETFDVVLSTFGVIFAPDQHKAASELLRVCRAGGKIGLANWAPTGANVAEERVLHKYFSLDPHAPPDLWGTQEGLAKLFGDNIASLRVVPRSVIYRFRSPEAYVDALQTSLGPFMRRMATLSSDQQATYRRDLVAALSDYNQSGDETLVIPFDYIEVVATKR
jgi:ubiquinone/menaquinone biosynthesis C-methylase UbiE